MSRKTSHFGFEINPLVTPIFIAVSIFLLYFGIELISKDISVVIGFVTLIFSDSLGVLFAKSLGFLSLASGVICFCAAIKYQSAQYLLYVSDDTIQFPFMIKNTRLSFKKVISIKIAANQEAFGFSELIIKAKGYEINLPSFLFKDDISSICEHLNQVVLLSD